jgi:hypothetical protein
MNDELQTDGRIRYLKSSEMIPISQYLPGAEAAKIWLALYSTIQCELDNSGHNPLPKSEQRLYEALTKKFSENLEAGEFFTATAIEQTEQP